MLTPELRQAIIAWLDATTAAIELWPLDPFEFSAIAARLTPAIAPRGAVSRPTGPTPVPKTCIICASVSSIIAIRWI